MLTAIHPQTNGQPEYLNQTIETYLRAFVSYKQDNWVALLPMAEFIYNNSVTMDNRMSLFYTNYGFHPIASDPTASEPLNPVSKLYAQWMYAVHKESTNRLEVVQEWMCRYMDPKRTEPLKYQARDLVMLNRYNIKTRRPSKKLDQKNHGHFEVEKVVSPLTVQLTLPRKWKIHNVFHGLTAGTLENQRTPVPTGPSQGVKGSQ